jgi:hypothetical protein
MASKYKLLSDDEKNGVWWNEIDYINLIKICQVRNTKLYKKLISDYEYLEGKKFDESLIK